MPLPRHRNRFVAALAVLTVVLTTSVLSPGIGEAAPAPVHARDALIDVVDGPVGPNGEGTHQEQLDATLYTPAHTPAPAVLLAHGFGANKDAVADQARNLAQRGFTVLTYSARGFGRSTGQIMLNDPAYEVSDARQLVSWLARQPEVRRDADNDPRVGVTGDSYGGALSLLLAGTDPRVDAIAPVNTYNDLAQALLPNTAEPATDKHTQPATPAAGSFGPNGVFKRDWAALLFALGASNPTSPRGTDLPGRGSGSPTPGGPGAAGASGPPPAGFPSQPVGATPPNNATPPGNTGSPPNAGGLTCGRLGHAVCRAYAEIAETGRPSASIVNLLLRVSPKTVTNRITAPTMLVQGEQDTLFGLDQADANARQIAQHGTPVKTVWYPGGHDGNPPGPRLRGKIADWFDFHLAHRGPNPGTGFTYAVPHPDGQEQDRRPRLVHAPGYPGLSGNRTHREATPLSGRPKTVVNPPGGLPASTSSVPSVTRALGPVGAAFAHDVPGQVARFDAAPATDQHLITGTSRVRLRVSGVPGQPNPGEAVLFAKLYDVGPDGRRTLPGNGVAPIRVSGLPADGTPTEITVTLPGIVHRVERGHHLQLAVTTTDRAYAGTTAPAVYRVDLAGNRALSIPTVHGTSAAGGSMSPAPLIGIGVVLAFALLAAVIGRIRRRETDTSAPELAEVPLAVSGLAKSFRGKLTAVRGLSLQVERGQVLGLLGPNGAGKTTTLRLLLGLLRPGHGEIRVFGHRVRPGAPVLSRVGAFVEGPGFLPHLSGADNLKLYWSATSRPLRDAHIDEVLEIVGLTTAARRKVSTYSHGMRQRLAIAQAMLGMPELLVLDEPTNGLDPPQIHRLREGLQRYAASGRTVLISSHLLAEVEQTCSHIAVLHRGELVTSGPVADIIAGGGEATFHVDSPEVAAEVLRGLDGIGDVETGDGVVHVALGAVPTSAAVHALVDAEVAVQRVGPRRRLEDAFLQLVGEEEPR